MWLYLKEYLATPNCVTRSVFRHWNTTSSAIPSGGNSAPDTAVNATLTSTNALWFTCFSDPLELGFWISFRKNSPWTVTIDGMTCFLASAVRAISSIFPDDILMHLLDYYLAKDVKEFTMKYSSSDDKTKLIQERWSNTKVITDVGFFLGTLIISVLTHSQYSKTCRKWMAGIVETRRAAHDVVQNARWTA
jgi:hypothetical protein